MKKLLVVLVALSIPFVMKAQFSISGKITDAKTNQALTGAHVLIDNTFSGTYTDVNGKFKIDHLKKGSYTVIISFIGYIKAEKTIELNNNAGLNISLVPKAILEDEVTISATTAKQGTPVTYTNLGKSQIDPINIGQDIPYLLDQTPSVVIGSDAGTGIGYTSLRIRGTDITRINFTINGIPINDPESHGVFFVNMPDFSSSVNQIQIQRGVGTSTNGAAAFGASVNLQSSDLTEYPYSEINASYGSFNTHKENFKAGTGLINGKFSFDARLSNIHSDGYIDRSTSDLQSFYLSGAYFGSKSILRLNVFSGKEKTYQAWWGVPKVRLENDEAGMKRYLDHWLFTQEEYDHMITSDSRTYNYYTYKNETDNYQQNHYQLLYSYKISEHLNLNTALHFTHGEGYYEQFKKNEDFADYNLKPVITGNDTINTTNLIRQKWLNNNFYGLTWSLKYRNNKMEAIAGGSANQYVGDHYGRIIWAEYAANMDKDYQWYLNTGDKKDLNFYGKVNYALTPLLRLFGDIQYRHIEYGITGIHDDLRDLTMNKKWDFINPKFGLFYSVSDNQDAYVSYAISNREPNRSIYRDADADDNPTAERLFDLEAGYNFIRSKFRFNANIYNMNYKNQLVMTGELNDVGAAILTNTPKSYRRGIELIGALKLTQKINVDGNLTISQNKILDYTEYVDDWDNGGQVSQLLGTTNLAFSPSVITGGRVRYTPAKGLDISILSKYVGKQYIDNSSNEELTIDPYWVNDLLIGYSFKTKWIPEVTVNIKVNNLLNTEYETFAWAYRYYLGGKYYSMDGYFPQAGRNILAGLKLKF